MPLNRLPLAAPPSRAPGLRSVRTQQRNEVVRRATAARCHSPQELGLLALCATCVALVSALVTFSILRDQSFLDQAPGRSTPVAAPLNP